MPAKVRKRTWDSVGGEKTAWVVDYFDQYDKRHIKTFATKRQAEAWRVQTEGEVQHGTHTAASTSKTIAAIADDWLAEKENVDRIERSTLKSYRNHVNGYVKPFFGTLKLSELTTPRVAKFKTYLSKKCHTLTMARMVLSSFKAMIAFAKVCGAISSNPTLEVKFGIDKQRSKSQIEVGKEVPSKSEIQAIIAHAEGRWRPLLITAIFTGLRSSELRGLRHSDINWQTRYITVTQRADEFGEIGDPKSKMGRRQIPMSKMVENALREWRLACPKSALDLVFPNGAGNIEYHTNIVHRGFDVLQRKLGMLDEHGKPKYGLHALRHFCCSHWLDLGVNPKQVQVWWVTARLMSRWTFTGTCSRNRIITTRSTWANWRSLLGSRA